MRHDHVRHVLGRRREHEDPRVRPSGNSRDRAAATIAVSISSSPPREKCDRLLRLGSDVPLLRNVRMIASGAPANSETA